jgi:hypothetical protein
VIFFYSDFFIPNPIRGPDRKNGINLIPSRYHWDQLDAKVIVLDINFPVRDLELYGWYTNFLASPRDQLLTTTE